MGSCAATKELEEGVDFTEESFFSKKSRDPLSSIWQLRNLFHADMVFLQLKLFVENPVVCSL